MLRERTNPVRRAARAAGSARPPRRQRDSRRDGANRIPPIARRRPRGRGVPRVASGAAGPHVGSRRPVHASTALCGPPRGVSFRALSDPGGPWTGSLGLHGRRPVASIRLEALGSAGPWPIPRSRPPLRGLRHPATLTVVFVTERLAAEHAALPVRGAAPRCGLVSHHRLVRVTARHWYCVVPPRASRVATGQRMASRAAGPSSGACRR